MTMQCKVIRIDVVKQDRKAYDYNRFVADSIPYNNDISISHPHATYDRHSIKFLDNGNNLSYLSLQLLRPNT